MNKKHSHIIPIFCLLLAGVLLAALPTEAEERIYEDTVRLHILANSDTEEDQAEKLAVRDLLLEKYGDLLSATVSASEAEETLRAKSDEICRTVNEKLAKDGFPYTAKIEISEEWFETRDYGDYSLPAGRYTALRVLLGEAEGHNWWCVMYPPMCLGMATGATYTVEETNLIRGGKYTVKFKLLELIAEVAENSRKRD